MASRIQVVSGVPAGMTKYLVIYINIYIRTPISLHFIDHENYAIFTTIKYKSKLIFDPDGKLLLSSVRWHLLLMK